MLTKKSSRFVAIRTLLLAGLVMLGMAGQAAAQGDNGPTQGEVRAEAMRLLQQNHYEEAIDMMYTYLGMVEESKMERVLQIAQDTRYKLAMLLIKQNRKGEAADVLAKYVSLRPARHVRKARKMLVACYFDEAGKDGENNTDMYKSAISAVTNAIYYNEYPDRDPAEIAAKEAAKTRRSLSSSSWDSDDDEDDEPDLPYSNDELEMLYFTMAESYFKIGELDKCLEPFTYVTERTTDEQRKGYSIMQMINAMIDLQQFDHIIAWIPELYRTPARFDIRVNLALLNAAAALFEEGEYDSALPLYRMILPRDELITYQEKKLREMMDDAGLPPMYGEAWTEGETLLFGEADADRQMQDEVYNMTGGGLIRQEEDIEEPEDLTVPQEITELQRLLETLRQMAPYESYVGFQTAQLYKNVERSWESVRFFDQVYKMDSGSDIGQRSVYESAAVLMDDLGEREEAETRAYEYLQSHHEGMYPRLVAYVLTRYYQRNKIWDGVKALHPYLDEFVRSDDVDLTRYDTELYFMQGVADLMSQQYSNAVAQFQYVIDEYSGASQEANSLFWCGFAYLCLDDHESAWGCFERYTRDFADLNPDESLLDEAYYQGGICLFGMNRLEEAKERFTYVIDTFGPSSTVYPDSCNMRGDIWGSEGGNALDTAIGDYKNAFNNATKASQATYATFKMCDIYKADEAFYGLTYIREQVNLYLARWADDGADIAKALFWLGRIDIQEGNYLRAAESYMNAVVDYGDNLRQDGVDQMIPELIKICKVFLDETDRADMRSRLRISMESTDSEVLRLRLRVALAKFDGTELELGKQLLTELPDLSNASPPVLSAICTASFALEDYSRSEELLRIFKYNFEDSDYMRAAYKLRAYGQLNKNDLDGTLETVVAAQEEYGTDPTESWAQLLKADILLSQSVLFSGETSYSRDELIAYSEAQLLESKDELASINEQLETTKKKAAVAAAASDKAAEDVARGTIERLLGEQKDVSEIISQLELAVEGQSGKSEMRSLLAKCKLDASREANKNVMGVPEWRGKPVAQAIYQLGQVEEVAGNLLEAHGYYQRVYFQYKGLGDWGAKGYIAAADVLQKMADEPGLSGEKRKKYEKARIDTLKAMLLDKYANVSPFADQARDVLGPTTVSEMEAMVASGIETNIAPNVVNEDREAPAGKAPAAGAKDSEGNA